METFALKFGSVELADEFEETFNLEKGDPNESRRQVSLVLEGVGSDTQGDFRASNSIVSNSSRSLQWRGIVYSTLLSDSSRSFLQ